MLLALLLAAAFVAFSNGANDNFKGVATIYGSGTAGYRTSLAWAMMSIALSWIVTLPCAALIAAGAYLSISRFH